jgi:hypothetical protein
VYKKNNKDSKQHDERDRTEIMEAEGMKELIYKVKIKKEALHREYI